MTKKKELPELPPPPKAPKEEWTKIPNAMLDNLPRFTFMQIGVLLAIYRNTMGQEYWRKDAKPVEMSNAWLVKQTGLSPESIRRSLKELIAGGWITEALERGARNVRLFEPLFAATTLPDRVVDENDYSTAQSSTPLSDRAVPIYGVEGSKVSIKEKKETTPKKKEKEKESTPNTEPTTSILVTSNPFSVWEKGENGLKPIKANGSKKVESEGKPDTTAGVAAETETAYTPEHMAAMKKKADEIATAMAKSMEIE
jgi:hypothetical protein